MSKKATASKTAKSHKKAQRHPLRNHPFVIPVTTFLVLFFLSLVGFVATGGQTMGATDSRFVRLYVDGDEQVIPTRAKTVGELLERRGITVDDKDIVEPSLDAEITVDDFEVNFYNAKPVMVVDEGKKTLVISAEPTPEAVAEAAGLKVYPEDRIERTPANLENPTEAIQDGLVSEKVIIERATPVHLNLYGKPLTLRTHADTVGELLTEKNVKLEEGDTVRPVQSTKLNPKIQVFVIREGKEIVSREEQIESPVERREDPSLDIGVMIVIKQGTPGKRLVTYEIELENGIESSRKEIQSIIIEQPTKSIVKVGTKLNKFSGSFAAALAALRSCESGGNYAINTGNGYYGAYQYNVGTWNGYGGYSLPSDAPAYLQDQKAWETYSARGWQPWPGCTAKLGLQDTYR